MFPRNKKNPRDSKKKSSNLRLFQKIFLKGMNVYSFFKNKPIIQETFGVLFAKVIDMTRLCILIIFDINKIPRSI